MPSDRQWFSAAAGAALRVEVTDHEHSHCTDHPPSGSGTAATAWPNGVPCQ